MNKYQPYHWLVLGYSREEIDIGGTAGDELKIVVNKQWSPVVVVDPLLIYICHIV